MEETKKCNYLQIGPSKLCSKFYELCIDINETGSLSSVSNMECILFLNLFYLFWLNCIFIFSIINLPLHHFISLNAVIATPHTLSRYFFFRTISPLLPRSPFMIFWGTYSDIILGPTSSIFDCTILAWFLEVIFFKPFIFTYSSFLTFMT